MADDVASFFKGKKTKKHGSVHSADIQNPNILAKRLEQTVQQQQVYDRELGVEDEEADLDHPRAPVTEQISGGGSAGGPVSAAQQINEESEWLDIQEQQEVDLAQLGIKEMELGEVTDEEGNEDDESSASRKTWNIPGQQEDKTSKKPQKVMYAAGMDVDDGEDNASADEKNAAKLEEPEKKTEEEEKEALSAVAEKEESAEQNKPKYVPPSLRNKQLVSAVGPNSSKKPNIEDSMEFPSLAAAGELEAEIEKIKKKKPMPLFAKKAAPSAHLPQAGEAPNVRHPSPALETAAETKPGAEPPRSAYVPPHLRKRGGAS